MHIKIATWNINSVRLRLPIVEKFCQQYCPDILCLQETKVQDSQFPYDAIQQLGFDHIYFRGEKSYNGVAILSKIPFAETSFENWVNKTDCRHQMVTLKTNHNTINNIILHNFYIPAGGDIPNRDENPKYGHKLDFVDEACAYFMKKCDNTTPIIILGDFNIAPDAQDVWSSKQLQNVVSHTEPEITRLNKWRDNFGFIDIHRHFANDDEKLYSWWSYRARDWQASNRGRRLDHLWITPPLLPYCVAADIIKEVRGWEKPSDHVPCMMTLSL